MTRITVTFDLDLRPEDLDGGALGPLSSTGLHRILDPIEAIGGRYVEVSVHEDDEGP